VGGASFVETHRLLTGYGLPAGSAYGVAMRVYRAGGFTKDAIYMGVTCYDSEPDKWLGYQRRRDEFLPADDRFMWTIDTFLDERSGYFFEMNPSGLMADSLFGINGDNRAWDGIWDARVRHSEIGWTIEIEIPFRTLNFDPNNDTWGFNFRRTIARKNEEIRWSSTNPALDFRDVSEAGTLTGITGTNQGLGLDIQVYGALRYRFDWQERYVLAEPLKIPKGSMLKYRAVFDNSANNPLNPNPDKEVYWSEQSWDEMSLGWIEYTLDKQRLPARTERREQ